MNIDLRLNVFYNDAKKMIKWLNNKKITKYLNEDPNTVYVLDDIISSGRADLLTYYLNKNAKFFLIDTEEEKCVGFITLVEKKHMNAYEIVVAIGEVRNWGKKIGYKAVSKILNEVFFNFKIENVISKVHVKNKRSIMLFNHLGFEKLCEKNEHYVYILNKDDYVKAILSKAKVSAL